MDTHRPSYIPEHYQCLGFDVDFHPLTTVTYILWLSIACQEQNRFICVWENECIYQTCEEFLIIMPVSQCTTACTVLSALGEVTNFAACRARPINFGNQSICHVYMTPAVVFVTQSFSICYKPAVDAPLKRCQNVSDTLDLELFNDLSTTPNSTCKSTDLSTTLLESDVSFLLNPIKNLDDGFLNWSNRNAKMQLHVPKYAIKDRSVKLNCSSDTVPEGNTAEFLINGKTVTTCDFIRKDASEQLMLYNVFLVCECSSDGRPELLQNEVVSIGNNVMFSMTFYSSEETNEITWYRQWIRLINSTEQEQTTKQTTLNVLVRGKNVSVEGFKSSLLLRNVKEYHLYNIKICVKNHYGISCHRYFESKVSHISFNARLLVV
ncbi:unnamed protein product [Mytilus edulis]|uniref:Uncharacterized protein n=1 Tax=Mytilus edulis TaxID=6550 RepID=A0A8S3UI49_MYTED|nr:unnamed protein product [Mytilus edulis]